MNKLLLTRKFQFMTNAFLPGQLFVLHDRDWEWLPWQKSPPLGGGLVQVRERVCFPPPHVTLQLPQAFQLDHPPLTV